MHSKTMKGRLIGITMDLDKIEWVCQDCGDKHAKRQYELSTWHEGKCDMCKKTKPVTELRDFGYFK